MIGKASQPSHLGYAFANMASNLYVGVLQVEFPQTQTLRWRLACRMLIMEYFGTDTCGRKRKRRKQDWAEEDMKL